MKRNTKLLSVCSLLLATILSMGILVSCDSSDNNTDDEDEDEKTTSVTTTVTTAVTTPAPDYTGMKVAGSKDGIYTMRIPEAWTVSTTEPLLVMGEDGSTNVNLVIEANTDNQFETVSAYAAEAKSTLEQIYGDMVTISDPASTKLDGEDASEISITLTVQEMSLKMEQIYCIKDGQIYILTFTAQSDAYAAQKPQFDRILECFTFE